ncbi:MAG: DNA/RNA non-specific endonuclease [Oceanospirillaceae bacterium]
MRVWVRYFVSSLVCINAAFAEEINKELIHVEYDRYELWIDCDEKAAIAFRYTVADDLANLTRYSNFYKDPNAPLNCHQLSNKPYEHHDSKLPKFERGQLAAANHFDSSKKALRQANYMSNVLPRTAALNRGSWKRTEQLIECYRDTFPVTTMGGVIWGTNDLNDAFTLSHGIKTPDSYWRLLSGGLNGNDHYISWILPNNETASSSMLQHYEISYDELIQLIQPVVSLDVLAKLDKLKIKSGKPFKYTKGCRAYGS